MIKNKWEKAGEIGIDAGICWIGDPCYIFHKDKMPQDIGQDWTEFCDKLEEKERYTNNYAQFNYDLGHTGLGVVVSTGYGDGCYPVYVKKNEEGRIIEVKVCFNET